MDPADEAETSPAGDATSEARPDSRPALGPHLRTDEPVRATFSCPSGYDCPDGPADSVPEPVELGVTDRRVLAVAAAPVTEPAPGDGAAPETGRAGAAEPTGAGADPLSLPFTELGAVSVTEAPELRLELISADEVTYRFPLDAPEGPGLDTIADLRWLGEVRGRVLASSQEVTAAADRIDAAARAGEVDTALETYDRARAVLDRLLVTVDATEPVPAPALAPGLTDVERALEAAVTRVYAARSRGHLDDASEAIDAHDFEGARSALTAARADRAAAERHAGEVLRPGDPQGAPERDLQETLRELGWEIEGIAAEPIRRAQEAIVDAEASADPAAAAERYENALRDFRGLLPLGWREGARQFDGDPRAVREVLQQVGERLVVCYRALAGTEHEAMVEAATGEELAAARDACETAVDHLERARDLAAEFDADMIPAVEADLETLEADADVLASGDDLAGLEAGRIGVDRGWTAGEAADAPESASDVGVEDFDWDAEPDGGTAEGSGDDPGG